MYHPAYIREDDWIVHRYDLESGNVLRFAAREVHKERTGIHASIAISINWINLAWTTFNIERDEDRVRLANSGYKHLDGKEHDLDRAEFSANLFKHALDLFCFGLWDEVVGQDLGEMMSGDDSGGPPQLLIGNYVIDGGGTIMYAAPGRGKSYTAMAMAVSLTWGCDKVWRVGDARSVLYINIERSKDSMKYRLARVNKALGLATETPLAFINARGKSLADVYEAAARTAEMHKCDVVFLDSISRSGFGDLNENNPANKIIDALNRLAPTWLAIAHTPRQDETHVYGSVHFDAGEDVGVGLLAQTSVDGTHTGIGLRVDKANDLPKNLPVEVHAMDWDMTGLKDIRRSSTREFPSLALAQQMDVIDQAKEYLLMVGKATAGDIGKELGKDRSTVSRVLNAAIGIGKEKSGKEIVFYVTA